MFKYQLHPNESLIQILRQTEVVLLKPLLAILVAIYLPWYFLLKYGLAADYRRLLLFWTILLLLYGIYKYILWLTNVYLITSKRVIKIRRKSTFNVYILENELMNIVNIGVKSRGVLEALFDFGNVEIQVLGGNEPIVFEKVRHPVMVKDAVWQAKGSLPQPAVKSAVLNVRNLS